MAQEQDPNGEDVIYPNFISRSMCGNFFELHAHYIEHVLLVDGRIYHLKVVLIVAEDACVVTKTQDTFAPPSDWK